MGTATRNARIAYLAGAVTALSGCNGEAPHGDDRDNAVQRSINHAAAPERFSDVEWKALEPGTHEPVCFAPAMDARRHVVWCRF